MDSVQLLVRVAAVRGRALKGGSSRVFEMKFRHLFSVNRPHFRGIPKVPQIFP
jgi:hypothetical protein